MSTASGRDGSKSKRAAKVSLLALLSPLTGLAAEASLAWTFGISGTVDAYRVGALVLVLANQLFFGPIMTGALVPVLSRIALERGVAQSWGFATALAIGVLISCGVLSLIFWGRAADVVTVLGPGLDAETRASALTLLKAFSFVFVLYSACGVLSGFLQSREVFGLPVLGQTLINSSLVLGVLMFGRTAGAAAIAWAVALGAVIIFGLYGWTCARITRSLRIRLFPPLVAGYGEYTALFVRLAAPSLLMLVATQWWTIEVTRALSFRGVGTLAAFGFAFKLVSFGLIVPKAISTSIFPALSRQWVSQDKEGMRRITRRMLRVYLLIGFSEVGALLMFKGMLIGTVYGHGQLSGQGIQAIASLILAFVLYIPAAILTEGLFRVAYAAEALFIPASIQSLAAITIVFMLPVVSGSAEGIVSLITWVHVVSSAVLLVYVRLRYSLVNLRELSLYFLKILLVFSVSLGVGDALMENSWLDSGSWFTTVIAATLAATVAGGLGWLLRIPEISEFVRFATKLMVAGAGQK